MGYPETTEGFCVAGPKSWNKFSKHSLKLKPFGDDDIDVKIEACGVCGSDLHTITGGWGEYEGPMCVGHEIVGKALKVGKNVKEIKAGDRVGVGAQVWGCLECAQCKNSNENYCPKQVDTYNAQYPDGSQAHGGYSSHVRAHQYWTFKIPDAIKSEDAAPLLCAGITTYSPLVRNNVGPGTKVAILGIGGLGHLAVQWAKALGAEVYAISHSPDKVDDIKKLGAKEVILSNKEDWAEPWAFTFDFILNCADVTHEFDIPKHLSTLRVGGTFHTVGISDGEYPKLPQTVFASNAAKMSGSHLGNNQEMKALLKLAAEKGIKPWVETIDISEKGCQEAVERLKENKVHYRFTLTGFDKAFGN